MWRREHFQHLNASESEEIDKIINEKFNSLKVVASPLEREILHLMCECGRDGEMNFSQRDT